jgi:hypothetical protein
MSRDQRGGSPTVVNLNFLDRSRYFFFQVAPRLLTQGLSDPDYIILFYTTLHYHSTLSFLANK